jgi:hypothetical protein
MMLKRVRRFSRIISEDSHVAPKYVLQLSEIVRKERIRT